MDVLYMLLILDCVQEIILQTCSEITVRKIAHYNKQITIQKLSCLSDLTLEQCALECLLLKKCKSFNYRSKQTDERYFLDLEGSTCELFPLNHNEVEDFNFQDDPISMYVDIRNWPRAVAGTCVSRPCGENQRCIPTTPYRCQDIDCGFPSVLPAYRKDITMYPLQIIPTLGSLVYHKCYDKEKRVMVTHSGFRCSAESKKLCNSDSTWTQIRMHCEK